MFFYVIGTAVQKYYAMRAYGGRDVWTHMFFTSALEVSG
jgi:hypothetical protein